MSINKEIINFEAIKFISMNGAGNKILIHDSRNIIFAASPLALGITSFA